MHLLRVCRYGSGDQVEIFDGKGFATVARIIETARDHVDLVAEGEPIAEPQRPWSITLATAFPKGERLDWLVEKATELGVDRLIPLVTERSVADPRESKLDRLRRRVIEASKQARRNRLMVVQSAMPWVKLATLPCTEGTQRLIASRDGIPPCRLPVRSHRTEILLVVGPEGGFTPAEEELGSANGWQPVRLASHVLRIETAALAGAAILVAKAEEQGHDEHN
jgi:16S rRNA (uracil1498-N3)-methyltransferase